MQAIRLSSGLTLRSIRPEETHRDAACGVPDENRLMQVRLLARITPFLLFLNRCASRLLPRLVRVFDTPLALQVGVVIAFAACRRPFSEPSFLGTACYCAMYRPTCRLRQNIPSTETKFVGHRVRVHDFTLQ